MRPIHLCAPLVLSLACVVDDGGDTGTATAATASDPSTADATADDSGGTDAEGGTSGAADTGDADASADDPSDSDPDDTGDSDPTSSDDSTGGLPDGVLAEGELFPADIIRMGDDIYWVNHMDADCVRRVPVGGGVVVDVACEPSSDTMPLQVIEYDGILAYSYMSTSGGPMSGFGGVRLVDPAGGAPETIDEGSRFRSSSSSPFCNDSLTASGSHLFWYAHELSEHASSIVHFDGSTVGAFAADSPFPYGVTATPTAIYWSATEAFERLPLDALGSTPMTVGTTQGSTCGRTAAGETLYLASRGTFATGPVLFRWNDGLFSGVRDLDGVAYDLAVDATHLYFAWESRVDRLPLANLEAGDFETLVDGVIIGGILVDDGNLYWSDYEGGEVRVMPVP
jgi:hypothetical protein